MIASARLRPLQEGRYALSARLDDGSWAQLSGLPGMTAVLHELDRLDELGRELGPGCDDVVAALYRFERELDERLGEALVVVLERSEGRLTATLLPARSPQASAFTLPATV